MMLLLIESAYLVGSLYTTFHWLLLRDHYKCREGRLSHCDYMDNNILQCNESDSNFNQTAIPYPYDNRKYDTTPNYD